MRCGCRIQKLTELQFVPETDMDTVIKINVYCRQKHELSVNDVYPFYGENVYELMFGVAEFQDQFPKLKMGTVFRKMEL